MFIGRTDVEAETPIVWPPNGKNWLIWKDPEIGKDWRQEEKGTTEEEKGTTEEEKGKTEDEMVGWHHQLNGYEFELAPGVGNGQGGLVCCNPWGRKELDTTEQLNWTESTSREMMNKNVYLYLLLLHYYVDNCLTLVQNILYIEYIVWITEWI